LDATYAPHWAGPDVIEIPNDKLLFVSNHPIIIGINPVIVRDLLPGGGVSDKDLKVVKHESLT